MTITQLPFSDLPMLAKTDRIYAEQNPILRNFYKYSVDLESFADVIADKSRENIDRKTLVETLTRQYAQLNPTASGNTQIVEKINTLAYDKTFTVVTAHQPSLLMGPLYFVYKIFSTIHLAEKLKAAYPDNNFVPIFVIGGEDHDFEEVNHISLFGKKLVWQRADNEKGAVGMMQTTSLQTVLAELKPILGESEAAQSLFKIIENAYTNHALYQDATQDLLNQLFGKYGLIVLNMNDAALKRLFIPVMRRELTEQLSKKLVENTQAQLESIGFKAQAFARDINLFYLRENLRERIVEEEGVYRVLNTDIRWESQADILKELEATPQYFSPNVVLRPLFQETVLPNLAYIGGGGELAYWLERQTQFAAFGVNFPMLIRRNSVMFLDKGTQDRLQKLDVQLTDLTDNTDILIKKYVEKQATDPLSMEAEKTALSNLFDTLLKKAVAVDATLEKAVLAEKTKQLQSLDALEARTAKAEKQKHETVLNQLKTVQQKLFPNGGLQERTDNILPIYLKHGDAFFDVLKATLNPLEQGMIVVAE
ncbi:MAG: bacillithiol biosynthesis cysteine-adding enzyme BshC [Saprospiraceae bacterium]|nr:bacillithiol biosynthesis cysteine-adding enzyme BshC [Saprospiraceae bacterium]